MNLYKNSLKTKKEIKPKIAETIKTIDHRICKLKIKSDKNTQAKTEANVVKV